MPSRDGLLLLGVAGERIVNHYSFYAAFRSPEEFRLVANGRTLGTLPVDIPADAGLLLIFGGRRWKVHRGRRAGEGRRVGSLVRWPAAAVHGWRQRGRRPRSAGDAPRLPAADLPSYLTAGQPQLLRRSGKLREVRPGTIRCSAARRRWSSLGVATELLDAHDRADRGTAIEVAQDGVCLTMLSSSRQQAVARLTEL